MVREKDTPGTRLVDGSPAVKRWLSRLQPSTRKPYCNNMITFMDWLRVQPLSFSQFTPDQLIEYQASANNGHRFDILNAVQDWLTSLEDESRGYKLTKYVAVKSFFIHNRAELPPDKSFRIQGEKRIQNAELKPAEIKAVIESSNTLYRAVFLSMYQASLDIRGLEVWSSTGYPALKAALEKNPEIIRVDLPGRKKSAEPYYTLIGPDAITAIRAWLEIRENIVKKRGDSGAIFINQQGQPVKRSGVSTYWLKHTRRLGLAEHGGAKAYGFRTGKNMHELRDTFRTVWAKTDAAAQVGEFLMGHQVDRLGYNKFYTDQEYVEAEYRKVLPRLNLLSTPILEGYVKGDEVENLRRQLRDAQKGTGDQVAGLSLQVERLAQLVLTQNAKIEELEKKNASKL